MDNRRSEDRIRINKKRSSLAALILLPAVLGITCASSYFQSMISQSNNSIKVAEISFGEDTVIDADLSGLTDSILPISEGDTLPIYFSTVFNGDISAYVIPILEIDNTTHGTLDEIIINQLDENGNIIETVTLDEDGSGRMIGPAILVDPGDNIRYQYEIIVNSLPSGNIPEIVPCFRLAAVQESGNEELVETCNNTMSDREYLISEIYKKDRGLSSEIKGFTVCTDENDIGDQTGEEGTTAVKVYNVCLAPDIEDGNPSEATVTWYNADTGDVIKTGTVGGSNENLNLRLSQSYDGLSIMFEVKNDAGIVFSPIYVFSIDENGVSVTEGENV